jgi:hypothetical protein
MTCVDRCFRHPSNSVTLVNGRQVCNECPEWMTECEARRVLRDYPDEPVWKGKTKIKPSKADYLAGVKAARGMSGYNALRGAMVAVHRAMKAEQQGGAG